MPVAGAPRLLAADQVVRAHVAQRGQRRVVEREIDVLARARKACADKARLAQLDDADGSRAGNSNHGWEDLAVFQAFSF